MGAPNNEAPDYLLRITLNGSDGSTRQESAEAGTTKAVSNLENGVTYVSIVARNNAELRPSGGEGHRHAAR